MDLKNIAEDLLDKGKKNRLINETSSNPRSIKVLTNNYDNLFELVLSNRFLSIPMIDNILKSHHRELAPPEAELYTYSNESVQMLFDGTLKKTDILCYKKGYPQTRIIRSIYKEYDLSITEKGINTLFITFGVLNYEEDGVKYKAPILLLPITMILENGIYKIKLPEDEVIVNPTLNFLLKNNYHTSIREYEDEELLSDYLNSLRDYLPSNLIVESETYIGIYSFVKINMYYDLVGNEENVLSNENIKALMGLEFKENDNQDLKILPVVNCDSSQLEAIKSAASGKSFCLQGPPGSGKSQTITNIIATLIGNGKKVLFVSEKLAALQVVYNNLRRVDLDQFTIEIHSNKANKHDFIEELYRTALLPKTHLNAKSDDIIAKHGALSYYLEEFCTDVHKEVEKNVSLYDCIEKYLGIDLKPLQLKINNYDYYNNEDVKKLTDAFDSYASHMKFIGRDYKELPYYGVKYDNDELRFTSFADLNKATLSISRATNNIILLSGFMNINDNLTLSGLNDLYSFCNTIKNLPYSLDNYFIDENVNKLIELSKKYIVLLDERNNYYLDVYKDGVYKENLKEIYEIFSANTSIFRVFNKDYKLAKAKLNYYRSSTASGSVLRVELLKLLKYNELTSSINEVYQNIKSCIASDFDINSLNEYNKLINDLNNSEFKVTKIEGLLDAINMLKIEDSASISEYFNRYDSAIYDYSKDSVFNIKAKLSNINDTKDQIKEYMNVSLALDVIKSYEQQYFLDFFLTTPLDLDYLSLQFKKQFLMTKIYHYIDNSDILKSFSSIEHNKKVNEFKDLDEKLFKINRDYIISVNSQARPGEIQVAGSKFKVLERESNKSRKQMPIKRLLEEIFDLALDIKPVFLMSPLSVATYLDGKPNIFDCVIFDEASQIYASDAFGAIYRAKQCIIIGDNKQMPPTSFFTSTLDSDDEEDEFDDKSASILDKGNTVFQKTSLKWHYRSRSEELITFSNQRFYYNGLVTIPQAKKHEVGFGIDYEYVDGTYNAKKRTNEAEAKRIVEMIIEHYRTSDKSLGVVAFSKVQAELISDLLNEYLDSNPEDMKYFSKDIDEPFFIKNLETVQGDERDRIIFSICYGYNDDGKFIKNFGPLNKLGGERRLNVAITRAKYNVTVVASIHSYDIKDCESNGAIMLHDYLEFAENVTFKTANDATDDGVILSVKRYLESLGYTCQTNYGASSFKIDLAVEKDNEFVLAILIDSNDHKHGNVSDVNRLYEMLLNRLGWKYYKIYAASWMEHMELEREYLKNALSYDNTDELVIPEIEESYLEEEESEIDDITDLFEKYRAIPDVALTRLLEENFDEGVKEFVFQEGPVTLGYAERRISKALGKKLTAQFKKKIKEALEKIPFKSANSYRAVYAESSLRLDSDREFDEIPFEELEAGIIEIVRVAPKIHRLNCYKELTNILGIKKLSDKIIQSLDDNALLFLRMDNKIVIENDCLDLAK